MTKATENNEQYEIIHPTTMEKLKQRQNTQDQEYTWLIWTEYLILGENIQLENKPNKSKGHERILGNTHGSFTMKLLWEPHKTCQEKGARLSTGAIMKNIQVYHGMIWTD